jgi:hypothetical protein
MKFKEEELISGKCCLCGKELTSYATKFIHPETKEIICFHEHEQMLNFLQRHGFYVYSDG